MTSKFWVGGGSSTSWAATGNTNWALTSGGSNNAAVPGTGDVAIFDGNSGTGNSVIGASIAIAGLDCQGGTGNYAGTITHNTSVTLTLNTGASNALRFASGMTYTPASTSSLVTFTHTSGTATVTCAGQKLFALTINGAGGTTQLVDTLLVNAGTLAVLTLTTGTLDAATNTAAITATIFSSSNGNTRALMLGGTFTIGGAVTNNATVWGTGTTTGLTFTKNSANIEMLAPTSSVPTIVFSSGSLTYNNLILDAISSPCIFQLATTTCTFAHLTVGAGWNLELLAGTVTTISNAFTWAGSSSQPMLVRSSSDSNFATISVPSGACKLAWGGLINITAQGGATFNATNSFSFGDLSGWSVASPADATVVLTAGQIASAVWKDTTAGDFTVAGSIGKDLFIGGVQPGSAGGHFIAGSNAATTVNITGNITGNLSGSIGSYTGNTPQTGDVYARVGAAGAGLTALGDTRIANLDAAVSSRASPTNITAGTITTVTNLTNAPTSGDLTATMKTSVTTAATASTPTAAAVTGAVGSVTGNIGGSVASVTAAVSVTGDLSATMKTSVTAAATAATPTAAAVTGAVGSVTGSVGSVTGLTASNLDAAVSSRLATTSYAAPDNTDIAAIKSTIGTAGAGLTALGDTRIAHLDADVSSRSTFAGGAVASVTAGVTVATNNDKSGYSVSGTITTLDALATHGDANWESSGSGPTAVQIRQEMDSNSTRLTAIETVTDGLPTFVHTAGKLWTLDDNGNPLASASQVAALSIPTTVQIADEVEVRTLLANIVKVNGLAITGDGAAAPWGPA